jgi:peroxiredoxin Q/BCP
MKRSNVALAVVSLSAVAGVWAPAQTQAPAMGQSAPEFSMLGSDSRAHSLRSHRGRQPVVLAFFPKAFTGG